jgi:NADPH-dependent 2,4-dienoyl-CoA reductase/sulfur reductase-like enzyme
MPGWTLPGVLNAGAAQIAMKSAGSVPQGKVWLVGSGPLVLLLAGQLLDVGAKVVGIVDTTPMRNLRDALAYLATAAIAAPFPLATGLQMLLRVRLSRLRWYTGVDGVRIEGDERGERVASVSFTRGRRTHREAADVVLLHHGVVPNTQLTRLLRVTHDWSDAQLAWLPRVDAWGETSLPGLRVAGDGAAIVGARGAGPSGVLAALGAAHALGRLDTGQRDLRALRYRDSLVRQQKLRPFLDALYRPPRWILEPPDEAVVCRCEEVTAGRIRELARLGCQGPNQTKFFSRCGMGPCQGRMCGLVVTQLLAAELGRPPAEVGAYRIRAPLKPVPIGALAALDTSGGKATAPGH